MARKTFTLGQAVEVQGVGNTAWKPAIYRGRQAGGKQWHVVDVIISETNELFERRVPDGRIRPRMDRQI